jgi:hypothetical protein
MRSISFLAAAALAMAACGGAAQPAPTSAPTKTAAPTVAATAAPTPATSASFSADLKSENEVPPISNEEKTGSGKATLKFDLTRDASGKLTAAKVSADVTFTGFPATTQIIIGHIHGPGAAGVNAGVKVPLKTDQDTPIPLTAGAGSFKKADIAVADLDSLQQILDNPSNWYVNFHSKLNAGGVVRGQMTKM